MTSKCFAYCSHLISIFPVNVLPISIVVSPICQSGSSSSSCCIVVVGVAMKVRRFKNPSLTLSRPGGSTLCPPHLYHSIFPKQLGVWRYCLVNFFYVSFFQKSSVPPISPHVCCHGNQATFRLIFENSILDCFSGISA